ncbi:MAG: Cof-type HAD-IIB family hydrolase [Moraxella sp.]|nr:Cof-type HAD-IIB family hydrolase [Moraxella sp.]
MTISKLTQKPKIIFFDIDDTLYIKYDNYIPDSTKQALHLLKQNGIIPAIATGRGIAVFPPCINELIAEIGIELFVTINGQYNEFQGKKLIDFPLNTTQISHTTNYLKAQNIAYAYMTKDEIIGFNETTAMSNALNSLHIPYRVIEHADKFTGADIYQILAFYDDNRHIVLDLDDSLKTVRWHISGVDILDNQGSKARGIKAVLDKLGLDFADAMAFGDGLNDVEMLKAVGTGVAMGNAHPALQAVADFVCPKHVDDGIYHGLKQLGVI